MMADEGEEFERRRRSLRQQYRDLIDIVQRDQYDLIDPSNDHLRENMRQADHLFQAVEMPGEAVLDSQLMRICSTLFRQKAEALNTNLLTFRPLEYAEKLVSFMTGGQGSFENSETRMIPEDAWIKLGATVAPLFKRSPSFHCMLGSFERGEVELLRQGRHRRGQASQDRENIADIVTSKPQRIMEMDMDNEMEKIVEKIFCILYHHYRNNGKRPISYFEFVVNPHSFAQTVENMFHLSFLVKDMMVELFLDELGLPVIKPLPKKRNATRQIQEAEADKINQLVISLNMEEWKQIVEVFGIKEPMIVLDICDDLKSLHLSNKKPRK